MHFRSVDSPVAACLSAREAWIAQSILVPLASASCQSAHESGKESQTLADRLQVRCLQYWVSLSVVQVLLS
jgi:hypothetical protein